MTEFPNELARWQADLAEALAALGDKKLRRVLRRHTGGVDFCSNDYLSLNSSGELYNLLEQTISRQEPFVGSTGSRLIRGHYEFFERAEETFARFTGFESSLLFQSGYAANTGVIPALVHRSDTVFADALVHASLIDGIRLAGARRVSYAHNDLNDLERRLARVTGRGRRWIVSETLFSMDGDCPDLPALSALAARHNALLMLDEAHAIGVQGPHGAGLIAEHSLQQAVAVSIFPCGKAPGVAGAFVCGTSALREVLINRARSFVFSTAQPPILADLLASVISRMKEYEPLRQRTLRNGDFLRRLLRDQNFDVRGIGQILPVIIGDEERALAAAKRCGARGFDVRAIRPPSVPAGTSRLRITVQAAHQEAELMALAAALEDSST